MAVYDGRVFAVGAEGVIGYEVLLAVDVKGCHRLRRITPRRLIIVPRAAEGFVEKAVACDDAKRVFSFLQKCGHVILVIPQDFVIFADGRNEDILGDVSSIYIISGETGALHEDRCIALRNVFIEFLSIKRNGEFIG